MTPAPRDFDLEKEAEKISLKTEYFEGYPEYLTERFVAFGRRCQDAAYERAAGIAAVYENIETGAISDKILALKSTAKDEKGAL